MDTSQRLSKDNSYFCVVIEVKGPQRVKVMSAVGAKMFSMDPCSVDDRTHTAVFFINNGPVKNIWVEV